jgi:hypothetical protein
LCCEAKGEEHVGAEIVNVHKRWLGMWSTPKLVAHAYKHIALQELWSSVNLNFSETAKEARFLAPENIWISTKVEEKEHCHAEALIFGNLVAHIIKKEPGVVEYNRTMFESHAACS